MVTINSVTDVVAPPFSDSDSVPSPEDVLDDSVIDEPVKRKRGRPPKNVGSVPKPSKPDKAPAGSTRKAPSWPQGAGIQAGLTNTFQTIGLGVKFLNSVDGESIYMGSADLAAALVNLATNDARYRRFLSISSVPGNYLPILTALGGIVLPIALNHGLLGDKPKEGAIISSEPETPTFQP